MTVDVMLETPRLLLRTVTMDDLEAVARSWNLDGEPLSQKEAENKVAWMLRNHRQNTAGRLVHLCLAIVAKETQAFIGWCGLDHRDTAEAHPVLFYLLQADQWGKGLATEAARALLVFAFTELALTRVDGRATLENAASKRVMEKIGMRCLGIIDGGYAFTLTRAEHASEKEGER